MPIYTTPVTTRSTKQNTSNTYCLNRVQKTLNLGLILVPSMTACLLLLPEILTSRCLTCLNRCKTAVSLDTILALESLFVVFKFWKNVADKCVANFFVLGRYNLTTVSLLITFKPQINSHNIMHNQFWRDSLARCLSCWFYWTVKIRGSNLIWKSLIDCLPGHFPYRHGFEHLNTTYSWEFSLMMAVDISFSP